MENRRFYLPVTKARGSEANELINFPTEMVQVQTTLADGSNHQVPGRYAIYRTDTQDFLGSVSDRYQMVNHIDAKRAVDKILYDEGITYRSSVELIRAGERMYATYEFPDYTDDIGNSGDSVGFKLILQNSMDGRKKLGFIFGAIRFACSNGMIVWAKGQKKSGVAEHKKHTQALDIEAVLGKLREGVTQFKDRLVPFWRGLAEKALETQEGLDIARDMIEKQKVMPKKYLDHVASRWTDPVRNFDRSRNAWSLYNAFTDATTHELAERSLEKSHEAEGKIHKAFEQLVAV